MLVDELGIEPTQALQELERGILRQDPALELPSPPAAVAPVAAAPPERAILVVAQEPAGLDAVLALATPLARRPPREIILALLLAEDADLSEGTAQLGTRREALTESGLAARSAAFTSDERGSDTARLAGEQNVDLLLLGVPGELVTDEGLDRDLADVLLGAPCDVAVLLAKVGAPSPGPGRRLSFHSAARSTSGRRPRSVPGSRVPSDAPLQLLGTAGDRDKGRRDASRLLAAASLAVQQVSGVAPEPVIVQPGPEGVIEAAADAGLVVLGLSDRWRQEGLGAGRLAVAHGARPGTLLVRGGVRPGGLAPRREHDPLHMVAWYPRLSRSSGGSRLDKRTGPEARPFIGFYGAPSGPHGPAAQSRAHRDESGQHERQSAAYADTHADRGPVHCGLVRLDAGAGGELETGATGQMGQRSGRGRRPCGCRGDRSAGTERLVVVVGLGGRDGHSGYGQAERNTSDKSPADAPCTLHRSSLARSRLGGLSRRSVSRAAGRLARKLLKSR